MASALASAHVQSRGREFGLYETAHPPPRLPGELAEALIEIGGGHVGADVDVEVGGIGITTTTATARISAVGSPRSAPWGRQGERSGGVGPDRCVCVCMCARVYVRTDWCYACIRRVCACVLVRLCV